MATKIKTIHKAGKKPIKFKEGALHKQLGVGANKKIPASKKSAALSGSLGTLAKKRVLFAKNVLVGRTKGK
jgi:hypothetical protein